MDEQAAVASNALVPEDVMDDALEFPWRRSRLLLQWRRSRARRG
jgi:hypothetical protein